MSNMIAYDVLKSRGSNVCILDVLLASIICCIQISFQLLILEGLKALLFVRLINLEHLLIDRVWVINLALITS